MGGLKRLYSNSTIYALGTFAAKAIGFIMIPVYTRCLTPSDYGTVELIYRATDVIALIAAMGLSSAVMRFYFEYKNVNDRNDVVGSGLSVMLIAGLALTCISTILGPRLSLLIFGHTYYTTLVRLAFVAMLLDLTVIVPLAYVQAESRPFMFIGVGLSKLITGLALNVLLIVHLQMGVMGVAWSSAISSAIGASIVVPWVIRKTGLRLSPAKTRQMLKYSLPLVPCQLGMFIISFADRFILENYGGVAEVGLYSLGYRFGILTSVLISEPFLNAWIPYALSISDTDEYNKSIPDSLRQFTIIAVVITLFIALFSRDVIRLMTAPAFYGASNVVPIIAFGHILRSLAFQLEIGIMVSKRTSYRIVTVGIASVVDIALCLLIIPKYGAIGAAWATSFSYLAFAAISYYVAHKLVPVRYDFVRVAGTIAVGIIVYIASTFLTPSGVLASLGKNFLFLMLFPVSMILIGIWPIREVLNIRKSLGLIGIIAIKMHL